MKIKIILFALFIGVIFISPYHAQAQTTTPAQAGTCAPHTSGDRFATVCTDLGDFSNIGSYIGAIIQHWVTPLAVIAAIVMITFAGFQFIYSGGSPEAIKLSKELIFGAVLGLALIFMAGFIIDKIINSSELDVNNKVGMIVKVSNQPSNQITYPSINPPLA